MSGTSLTDYSWGQANAALVRIHCLSKGYFDRVLDAMDVLLSLLRTEEPAAEISSPTQSGPDELLRGLQLYTTSVEFKNVSELIVQTATSRTDLWILALDGTVIYAPARTRLGFPDLRLASVDARQEMADGLLIDSVIDMHGRSAAVFVAPFCNCVAVGVFPDESQSFSTSSAA